MKQVTTLPLLYVQQPVSYLSQLIELEFEVTACIVLRLMVELRQRDGDDWQKTIKQFALQLTMTPAPLCGNLRMVS